MLHEVGRDVLARLISIAKTTQQQQQRLGQQKRRKNNSKLINGDEEERKTVLGNWKANRILYFSLPLSCLVLCIDIAGTFCCCYRVVVPLLLLLFPCFCSSVVVVGVCVCIRVVQQMMCRPIRQGNQNEVTSTWPLIKWTLPLSLSLSLSLSLFQSVLCVPGNWNTGQKSRCTKKNNTVETI